jgi:uncharacterized protein
MWASDTKTARRTNRQRLHARWPVLTPLALMGIGLLRRIVDVFVRRLDERLGEIILSKSLGFALVVGYTWWVCKRLSAIALHGQKQGPAVAIGAGFRLPLPSPRSSRSGHSRRASR